MNKTMAVAKHDFEIGYLDRYAIERSPMGDGWMLDLGSGNSRGWLVDARSKEPRVFKSLDGAVSALEQIGFKVLLLGVPGK